MSSVEEIPMRDPAPCSSVSLVFSSLAFLNSALCPSDLNCRISRSCRSRLVFPHDLLQFRTIVWFVSISSGTHPAQNLGPCSLLYPISPKISPLPLPLLHFFSVPPSHLLVPPSHLLVPFPSSLHSPLSPPPYHSPYTSKKQKMNSPKNPPPNSPRPQIPDPPLETSRSSYRLYVAPRGNILERGLRAGCCALELLRGGWLGGGLGR